MLFPEREIKKNRRFTASEWELEKLVAAAFKRPQRHWFRDRPTYPYCVPEPCVNQLPYVNFKLNYKE